MEDNLLERVKAALENDPLGSTRRKIHNVLSPDAVGSWWTVEDFEQVASNREDDQWGEGWREWEEHDKEYVDTQPYPLYDRSKFREALHRMVEGEDANWGITWQDVEHYLDKYCQS